MFYFLFCFVDKEKPLLLESDVRTTDLSIHKFIVKSDTLRRYQYYTFYAEPLLRDFETIKKDSVFKLPREVTACFLTEKTDSECRQIIKDTELNQITFEEFQKHMHELTSTPFVVIVDENEVEILKKNASQFRQNCIVLMISEKEKQMKMFETSDHEVLFITTENVLEDMDKALEKNVVSILRSALDFMGKSGKSCI